MTAERRKALLMMGATLALGIVVGALVTGMFARQFYHGREGRRGGGKEMREGRRGTLTDRIFKVVKADSSQQKKMRPIIDQAMSKLDDIEEKSNQDLYAQLDSLKIKLRPVLEKEQVDRLERYLSARVKAHKDEEKREHEEEHEHH